MKNSSDSFSADRTKVEAAARALAGWARARRATWTDVPLPLPVPHAAVAREEPRRQPGPAAAAAQPNRAPSSRLPVARLQALREPLVRWLTRGAAAAAVIAVIWAGVSYVAPLWRAWLARRTAGAEVAPAQAATPAQPPKTTGSLRIASTPEGARVVLDGTVRGVTPLTLDEVAAGRHTVLIESSMGSVQKSVTVAPGAVADVDESIFSGFITIYAPFELSITEGAHAFRPDERNEILLPAGRHDLRLTNRALGYDEVRTIDLKPGERATLSVTPPQSAVTVTASEAAEVWVDGTRAGETPLTGHSVNLGTHEIVVRRAAGDERRFTVTVTVKPFLLHVDFSKPG